MASLNFNIALTTQNANVKCINVSLCSHRIPLSLHSAYHWQHLSNPHHMASDVLLNCFHLSRGAINFETRNSASPLNTALPTQLSACNLSIRFGVLFGFVICCLESGNLCLRISPVCLLLGFFFRIKASRMGWNISSYLKRPEHLWNSVLKHLIREIALWLAEAASWRLSSVALIAWEISAWENSGNVKRSTICYQNLS